MTTTYNLDPHFVVYIPTKDDSKEFEPINDNINFHTEGSKLDDNRTGAGVIINYSHIDSAEEAIHLGDNATVFQAEVFVVGRTASHLIFAETKNKRVAINCDSQAAIMALDNTKIKSKTTLDAVTALSKLGENNHVLIRWIQASSHLSSQGGANDPSWHRQCKGGWEGWGIFKPREALQKFK